MAASFTPINRDRTMEIDSSTPHPLPIASLPETPERHPPSASPQTATNTKRTNAPGGSGRRVTHSSMGVQKRSGSGAGGRAVGGGGVRLQADLVAITDDMTEQERDHAMEQNKQIQSRVDERVRNNQSAKRSRLKRLMYIVDMDNTIQEYAHNVMEFKQAYDTCKAVIMRHNLESELGHAFVEPVVWQRPDVIREQENDVASHRANLQDEAENPDLYNLGFQFAEKVRALVKKTGAAERNIIAKALEEQRRKVEECARKEAQYEAQMKEHERKAAEMKVKIEEVQKQQAEYRITAEKYGGGIIGGVVGGVVGGTVGGAVGGAVGGLVGGAVGGVVGGGRAKHEDKMDLDPIPEAVLDAQNVPQAEEDPFVVQGLKPPPFPARQGAGAKTQDKGDFANMGKVEGSLTLEQDRAQQEFELEVEQWAQTQSDITNPDIPGSGYDGLPGLDFLGHFGFGGETQFFNPVDYTSQQQSSPGPANAGFNHGGGNATNARPTTGTSAYNQDWSANYQQPPHFSPRGARIVLHRTSGSGHHGPTSQSHAQPQFQRQPANPVWDPMQHGDEYTFGDNSEA